MHFPHNPPKKSDVIGWVPQFPHVSYITQIHGGELLVLRSNPLYNHEGHFAQATSTNVFQAIYGGYIYL